MARLPCDRRTSGNSSFERTIGASTATGSLRNHDFSRGYEQLILHVQGTMPSRLKDEEQFHPSFVGEDRLKNPF